MAYPISVSFMIYHGGDARLEPALGRAIAWIEAETEFEVAASITYSDLRPAMTEYEGVPHLAPWDVDWAEIPLAEWVVLLWKCEEVRPCPAFAGGTWGLADWLANGSPFVISSIPYDPYWNCWQPKWGFDTWLEQVLLHEWKNGLVFWLNDGFGYNLLNTYADGEFIDCGLFPEETRYADCYRAFIAQLTTEMYEAMASLLPPAPAFPAWVILPAALVGIVAVGSIIARKRTHSQ